MRTSSPPERLSSRQIVLLKGFADRATRQLMGSLTHVVTRESAGALTFDDGPDPEWTPKILDSLERHGARATFFMVGERAASHPDLVHEVAARGHALANHSWDHGPFTRMSTRQRWRQVMNTKRQLAPQGTRLFRPPKGHMNMRSRRDLLLMRYTPVMWNIAIEDWRTRCVQTMTSRLLTQIRPGCIVLLHDSIWESGSEFRDRRPLVEALDAALADLTDYQFVTLPELFEIGRPFWSPWVYDE